MDRLFATHSITRCQWLRACQQIEKDGSPWQPFQKVPPVNKCSFNYVGALTRFEAWTLVKIVCTRQVLLKIAPKERVKPIDKLHTRAFSDPIKIGAWMNSESYCADEVHRCFRVVATKQRRVDAHEQHTGVGENAASNNQIIYLWTGHTNESVIFTERDLWRFLRWARDCYLCVRNTILKTKNPIAKQMPMPLIVAMIE